MVLCPQKCWQWRKLPALPRTPYCLINPKLLHRGLNMVEGSWKELLSLEIESSDQLLFNNFFIQLFPLWKPQKYKMGSMCPKNGWWDLERGLVLSFWVLRSTFANQWPTCKWSVNQGLSITVTWKFSAPCASVEVWDWSLRLKSEVEVWGWSLRCPVFIQQNLEIYWFLSSGSKICFCCRTKSFEARGPIFWNQALHLAILESYDGTVTESTNNRDFGGEGVPPHAYLSSKTKEVPTQ